MEHTYLIYIALILISTKILGIITGKLEMPRVVGALLAGLLFGPMCLNVLHETEFLTILASLGVIMIMFSAGLTTDLNELKQTGKAGFLVAILGVVFPLAGGTALAYLFNSGAGQQIMLENIFIGIILTATSVSITVETLKELGKLSTKVGNTILAAALIDDVLGLICLTLITSVTGASVNIFVVLLKIVLFFILMILVGFIINKGITWYSNKVSGKNLQRFSIFAVVICLVFAYVGEEFFGVADIIGAFAAGLIIASTPKSQYIQSKITPLSYLLLTPIFFASIGLKIEIPEMEISIILFAICLVIMAILSKLIGCGIGAKICGFKTKQCVQIGFGMACRGEVALIVANKGMSMGLLPSQFFGPIVIMVVCAAVFTPVLLRMVFKKDEAYQDLEQSNLAELFEEQEQIETITSDIIDRHNKIKK